MVNLMDQINLENLPEHVAIIMDGNGRWAKAHGKPRVFGHKNGVNAVREVTECAAELGIRYLTLYAFSTENWGRPQFEVTTLMDLLVETIKRELSTLNKNNIKLQAIGDLQKLPAKTYKALMEGIENTRFNTRMTLVLALNYSSRWEITEAVKNIASEIREGNLSVSDIKEEVISQHLSLRIFLIRR
jgi:undecaprenyl diphosphate synthase